MDNHINPAGHAFLGIQANTTNHYEKLISALGGFLGIVLAFWCTHALVGTDAAILLVGSMGASAVLLFANPHGLFSQPWPLLGGHLVSALVGVACRQSIPDTLAAAGAAVGLAIAAMYYLRCIHPPGGGTALIAVLGGPAVENLGYGFVLAPVLLNTLAMLLVAIAFNYPFAWRRYPASLIKRTTRPAPEPLRCETVGLSARDFEHALQSLDSFIDISVDDLTRLYQLAHEHAQRARIEQTQLAPGRHYSNGECGERWSVRLVLSIDAERISYRVIAGPDQGSVGSCTAEAFAQWAQHEVARGEAAWRRVVPEAA